MNQQSVFIIPSNGGAASSSPSPAPASSDPPAGKKPKEEYCGGGMKANMTEEKNLDEDRLKDKAQDVSFFAGPKK